MNVVNELTDTCKMKLTEKCQEIDNVYKYRKQADHEVSLKCLEAMRHLSNILTGVNGQLQDDQQRNFAARYLINNKVLIARLVQIVADSEDIDICYYALYIIYILLTIGNAGYEEDIKIFKKNLNTSANFSLLWESIYSITLKFSGTKYHERLTDLQAKLLRILSAGCVGKQSRELYFNVSLNTICLLRTLLSTACCNNSKLLSNLLSLLNVLCHNKSNCKVLASAKFFDALYNASKVTKKVLTILSLLTLMSRDEETLQHLSSSVEVFLILLDMLNYSGRKHLNKQSVITILYRITKTDAGLQIFKREEIYECLLEWIIQNQKPSNHKNKLTVLKAYSILNRTITKTILNPKLTVYENCIDKYVTDMSSSSEESDGDNEIEKQCERFKSHLDIKVEPDMPAISRTLAYISEMQLYFVELFKAKRVSKPKIFENLTITSDNETQWKSIVEQCVIRNAYNNKHSYPDSELLEAEFDYHRLNTGSKDLNVEFLVDKFKCAKGIKQTNFKATVVYDLIKNCSQNCSNSTLVFDSHFECGNLNTVIQTNELEYDLVLSPDTGSCKGFQWFYFQVSNIQSGLSYTFNIVNFLKVNSQYNYGMQPLLFSITDYMLNGIAWKRCGKDIVYFENNYTNFNGSRQYRTLSFSIAFNYSKDCVYLAYHYPYTYTRLMAVLYPIASNNSTNVYKRVDKLCNTINNNEVPLLTITAAVNKSKSLRIPITERPIIFITARVHPGETNSSWITEGMIKFLLNEANEEANRIREYFIFKIIPMLNIEGVIYGNTRSGISGSDLNRCWANPKQNSCSEIYYTKKLIEYAKKELKQDVAAFIDIHGHSRKKFFFFYGCNPKMSWNKEDLKQNDCLEALELLPQMASTLNPHISLKFCKYKIEKNRESSARVVIWREFGIQNSYTLECSYCSGSNNQAINTKILTEIGANVIAAVGMMHENRLISKPS